MYNHHFLKYLLLHSTKRIIKTSVFLLFMSFFHVAYCQCPDPIHADYTPLIKLYHATKGDQWTNNSGWKEGIAGTNCDPCNNWFGVTCTNNRVTKIVLSNNKLVGTFPPEFEQLKTLNYLDVRTNSINGAFPLSLCGLENLTYLNLFRNNIFGTLPPEIGNLKKLKGMYFSLNSFYGVVPFEISNMVALENLNLSNNNFSGEVLEKLIALPNINSINISNNKFTGIIPQALAAKPKLNELRISFNKFNGSIPGELGDVLNLFLDNNNLSGCIDSRFFSQCTMPNRSIANNPLLPWKGDLVEYCKTSGKLEEQIGAPCKDPRFSFNQKFNQICECAGDCGHPDFMPLMEFYHALNGYSWTKKTGWNSDYSNNCNPCSWHGITCDSSERVIAIQLIENRLNGQIPAQIKNLNYLEILSLPNNNISGFNTHIFDLPNLKILELGNNPINSTIPVEIVNAKKMERLGLGGTGLHGSLPNEITQLTNLKVLNLFSNNLSGQLPDSMTKLVSLEKIFLTANNFTGPFIQDIDKLANLKEIRAESNKFSGPLPEKLTLLSNLTFAWFENNKFDGCIPESYKVFCPALHKVRYSSNPNLAWHGESSDFCNSDGTPESQNGANCGIGGSFENCQCIPDNRACFNPDEVLCLTWLRDTLANRQCGGTPHVSGFHSVSLSTLNDEAVILVNTDFTIVSEVGLRIEVYNCLGVRLEDCSYSLGVGCSNTSIVNNISPSVNIYNCRYDTLPENCANRLHPDFRALMDFYEQSNGATWNINYGWEQAITDTLSNPCQWYGVKCNTLNRVDTLILSDNNMTGELKVFSSKLPYLRYLDFSKNKFEGHIPSNLYNLKSLSFLNLTHNSISGSLSNDLNNLNNLSYLNLSHNLFEGEITNCFDSLNQLQYLDICHNNFVGLAPKFAFHPYLLSLALNNNQFSGCLDPSFKNLCSINVNLSNNPSLPWQGDFLEYCITSGKIEDQIFSQCDDLNPTTLYDQIDTLCQCRGSLPSNINILPHYNNLKINPNPANDLIYLSSEILVNIVNIKVTNIYGISIELNKWNDSSLDISGLPKGTYILTIQSNIGMISSKFVKL
ncbi:MAG: T9SS type A sorting domain-containing protein [Saprospiraceae bacterium]|nr:T9SS type A sorting domain-containing protein [Saprospiraceae bacterium]